MEKERERDETGMNEKERERVEEPTGGFNRESSPGRRGKRENVKEALRG